MFAALLMVVLGVRNLTVRYATQLQVGAPLYRSAQELFLSPSDSGRVWPRSVCIALGFSRYTERSCPSRHAIPAVLSAALLCSAVPGISPASDLVRHHPCDTVDSLQCKNTTQHKLDSLRTTRKKGLYRCVGRHS